MKRPLTAKNREQKQLIKSIISNPVTFTTGTAGSGKAQPLDSIVYTPDGPKLMGDLEVGDVICTPFGVSSKIRGIYPQGKRDVYRITFKNGDSVECTEDHLWGVERKYGKPARWAYMVLSTKELMESGLWSAETSKKVGPKGWYKRYKYRIHTSNPVQFDPPGEQLIDPYVMGALLGDGGLTQPRVTFTSADESVVELLNDRTPDLIVNKLKEDYSYSIKQPSGESGNNYVLNALKVYDLIGKSSLDKHIPREYKYGSIESRLELIRGLMDTDGCVNRDGTIEYSSSSRQLAYDTLEVLESLGCICNISKKSTTHNDSYRIYVNDSNCLTLFHLDRKLDRLKESYTKYRYIESIECIGIKKECQCISIEDSRQLYLTNNFIPTHNTMVTTGIALEKLTKGECDKVIISRPLVCTGKQLPALPGDLDEKMQPFWIQLWEYVRYFLGDTKAEQLRKEERIMFVPLEIMRGMNFHRTYTVVTEAQNASYEQLKMLLTRIGDDESRIIIDGDIEQTDLRVEECPMETIMRKLESLDEVGQVHLVESLRHPVVTKIAKLL